ncbi:MAG: hypothetical protein IPJ41_11230 [Phycisphaerales bacterium]|nr:hypothetical protein [Phycisphaerales bacterium]
MGATRYCKPGAAAASAAMLAVVGLAARNAHAQPRSSSAMMRSMMYDQRMFGDDRFNPSTFDEFADADMDGMMRRGREEQASLKSELARQIVQQDYTRDPEGVLAARVRLASEARNLRLHPDAADEDGSSTEEAVENNDDGPTDFDSDEPAAIRQIPPDEMQAILDMGGDIPPELLAAIAGGGPTDDADVPVSSEDQKKKIAERKQAAKEAQRFRLLVVAGRWDLVAEFLGTRFVDPKSAGDAAEVYSFLLKQLVSDDQAMTPDEIIAVAEAAPVDLTDAHISALGSLIQAAADRGCDTGPLAATIRRGTRQFGGPEEAPRKRAAALLVAAGMPVAAQEYLPPLSAAETSRDADLLNLYAVYFHALTKERAGEEQREAAREGWRLCQEVLSIENATNAQRSKALTMTLRLLDAFDREQGDDFLKSLFASESEIAWLTLDRVNRAAGNLLQRQAPAEFRLGALRRIQRVGEAVIAGSGGDASAWQTGLDMLTLTLLREAEMTRSGEDDPRMPVIPADQLASVLPDAKWLTTIDPGLAAKLEVMVAATDGGSGETGSVLAMIRPIIGSDPDRARKLAGALIDAWPKFVGRGAAQFDDYDPYGMMSGATSGYAYAGYSGYPSYGSRGSEGAVPLTRARQRRSLDRLGEVLAELKAAGVRDLPADSLVVAFGASHSAAEIYARSDIEAVFGAFDTMPQATRSRLIEDMRGRLGAQWRSPQVQEQANTKRTDKQLASEVQHGYDLALDLAASGVAAAPRDWRARVAVGNLNFDRAEFLYGQNVDFETYTAGRDAAFAAFSEGARLYAETLASPDAAPTGEVYLRWFSAALGASDLGFLTRQDQPDVGQIGRLIGAIDALPGDEPERHRGLFAKSIEGAVDELNPELKPRFIREAMRIIGDHPDGRRARELLQYYDDLLQEIELVLTVDGPTQVGHADAFGVNLAIWSTRQTAREAGSFSKYLRNEMWHPATGQQVDYRDDLEKHIRETLGETFEVVGVQFLDPSVQSVSVERPGWEAFPLAYLLLKPKDARTDRVPALRLDMDFSDGQGYVILPVVTPPVLIDAKDELPASRRVADLEIEEVLDDRMVATDGKIRIEIHAKGRGVVPTLPEILDTSTLAPFGGVATEDHGLNIVALDTAQAEVVAVTERSWTMELTPASGEVLRSVTFPTGRLEGSKVTLQRYADADIVEAPATASILPVEGPRPWWPIALGGGSARCGGRRRGVAEAAGSAHLCGPNGGVPDAG